MTRDESSQKILFVLSDVAGPVRNGGIGTAYTALALALAEAGCEVTILYTLGNHCERETIDYWRHYYAGRSIAFEPLPTAEPLEPNVNRRLQRSYDVYLWLKGRRFDIVHFHEWQGNGYYPLMGKKLGLCLNESTVVVGIHSSTLWNLEGNKLFVTRIEELETDHMERMSAEWADIVWIASEYMATYVNEQGWKLPEARIGGHYLLPSFREDTVKSSHRRTPDELVFFGRLDIRKGVALFCDAVDALQKKGWRNFRVTFLGKSAQVYGRDSVEYLRERASHWEVEWGVEFRFGDDALAYLANERRLAVLPSLVDNMPLTVLECVHHGLAFIAADTGGIPEIVDGRDRAATLFEPTVKGLVEKVEQVLTDGVAPARATLSHRENRLAWIRWHEETARTTPRSVRMREEGQPLVSVCVTHFDRPAYLSQALDSLRAQSYPHIEVIVVDDGSPSPEAHSFLASLEPEFLERDWRIVRQENRFHGAARNNGASGARGEYLMFMDDDNVAKPHEVETFVAAALCADADVVTCFLDTFSSETPPADEGSRIFRWPFLGPSAAVALFKNCIGDTNALVRKAVFDELGGFHERYGVGHEDWAFYARAILSGYRVFSMPEALVWYRRSESSQARRQVKHYDNHMQHLNVYLDYSPPPLRNLLRLCHGQSTPPIGSPRGRTQRAAKGALGRGFGHVKRYALFGCGSGGKAFRAMADRLGWRLARVIDNNPDRWGEKWDDVPITSAGELEKRDFDLIVVASVPGRLAISGQLRKMGFEEGVDFLYFLDHFTVDQMEVVLAL